MQASSPTVPTSTRATLHKHLVTMAVRPLRGGLVAVLSTLAPGLDMPTELCSPVDLKPWAVCSRSLVMISTAIHQKTCTHVT
jgi:hypothetical protein